jgi:hypothetical protein
LIEDFGAVVEPVDIEVTLYAPHLVELGQGAAAYSELEKRCVCYLGEGVRGGVVAPDIGMDIEAKYLISASGNTGESAFNLLKMLC